ncbi:MAG: beta-ketoacyl synthase N-terminal-like domain-containing protein [Parvularculaceae bacterium]
MTTKSARAFVSARALAGFEGIARQTLILHEQGVRRVSPFFITGSLISSASADFDLHKLRGPNLMRSSQRTCRAHATAGRGAPYYARRRRCHGGGEAPKRRSARSVMPSQRRKLTTHFNDNPKAASRPYDQDRDGFLMGEGAGILILEEYERR